MPWAGVHLSHAFSQYMSKPVKAWGSCNCVAVQRRGGEFWHWVAGVSTMPVCHKVCPVMSCLMFNGLLPMGEWVAGKGVVEGCPPHANGASLLLGFQSLTAVQFTSCPWRAAYMPINAIALGWHLG